MCGYQSDVRKQVRFAGSLYGTSVPAGSSTSDWRSDLGASVVAVASAAAAADSFSLSPTASIQSILALNRRARVSLSGITAGPAPLDSDGILSCSFTPFSSFSPAGSTRDGSDLYRIAGRPLNNGTAPLIRWMRIAYRRIKQKAGLVLCSLEL